jgi:hypothetical protein
MVDFTANVELLQSMTRDNAEFGQHLRSIALALQRQNNCEYDTHDVPPLKPQKVAYIVICQRNPRHTQLRDCKGPFNILGSCQLWLTSFDQDFIDYTLINCPSRIRHCLNNLYITDEERLEVTCYAQGLDMFYAEHIYPLVAGKVVDYTTFPSETCDRLSVYGRYFALPVEQFVNCVV